VAEESPYDVSITDTVPNSECLRAHVGAGRFVLGSLALIDDVKQTQGDEVP
jgi:hypothetical protein